MHLCSTHFKFYATFYISLQEEDFGPSWSILKFIVDWEHKVASEAYILDFEFPVQGPDRTYLDIF